MTPLELAARLAKPVGTLGAGFYFDPGTAAAAEELGLNVYEFYGLGRGGVLGAVDEDAVQGAFHFFHPRIITMLWTNARAKADPVAVAERYVAAAYAFADRTFGAVPLDLLEATSSAARAVVEDDELGRHALADGYRRVPAPDDPVHGAYLGTILLRELRGGIHIDAVIAAGLTPAQACYLDDAAIFALHGYRDEDAPVVSSELEAAKAIAEAATDAAMAEHLAVLDDQRRDALASGVDAMAAALANPVPRER